MQLLGEIKSMSERFHPPLIVCSVNHAGPEVTTLRILANIVFIVLYR